MIKKIVFLSFIPIFILLYMASGNGSELLGLSGIIIFVLAAISQIIVK